jgi:tetratricopeptide (TPR) repeat protein
MPQLKFAFYALMLEIGAWSGPAFLDSRSDLTLAWYLGIHLLASLLLSVFAATLLPHDGEQKPLPRFLLMAAISYALPVVGFVGVCAAATWLRRYRSDVAPDSFEAVRLPEFDPHQRPQSAFRQSGLRSFLGNPQVPAAARVGAMVALQYVSGRVSSPLLRGVLSDSNEDIRLLAYGMLDNKEKGINRAIDAALRQLRAATASADEAAELDAAQRLSDLYWELVYQELAQGDLRDYAIRESLAYCDRVLDRQPQNAPLNLRRGRLLHALGRSDEAGASYRQALALGLPATRVLPYQAEIHYVRREFADVRRIMTELAQWRSLPRLQPVIDCWSER